MTKFKLALFAGVAALSLASLATSASAITMQAVYTGTVSNGYELTNDFGLGLNTSFSGNPFTMTFIYDPATPGSVRTTIPGSSDRVSGGSYFVPGIADPFSSAKLTINGHSQSVGGNYNGDAFVSAGHIYQVSENIFNNGLINNLAYLFQPVYSNGLNFPTNLETPYMASITSNVPGAFQFQNFNIASGIYSRNTIGHLSPTNLTITRVSVVPLPAALPLFGLGLGALGMLGRSRRKKAV